VECRSVEDEPRLEEPSAEADWEQRRLGGLRGAESSLCAGCSRIYDEPATAGTLLVTDIVLTVLEDIHSSDGGTDVALLQFLRLCIAKGRLMLTSAFSDSMISAEATVLV
jgi:hypothetical protein